MKTSRLLVACLCSFLLLLFGLLIAFNHAKPRLLVLHSFSENGSWEQRFNQGVQNALAANRLPIAIRWHYMSFGYSEVQSDADWMAAGERAHAVIQSWKPDVILIVGEEAQQWLGYRYASQNPKGQRMVFATSEDPQRFGYVGTANVTGVREMLPLAQVREVLARLQRGNSRILALGVADATGDAEAQQVQGFDWAPGKLAPVQLVKDYAAWQQAVTDAADAADVLLILSFAGLPRSATDPTLVDPLEVAQWTEGHARPLPISVRARFVQGGGALSVSPSTSALGEQAARLALQAMPGQPLPAMQVSEDFAVGLRVQRLAARGLQLPDIYVQTARASGLLYREPQGRPSPAATTQPDAPPPR